MGDWDDLKERIERPLDVCGDCGKEFRAVHRLRCHGCQWSRYSAAQRKRLPALDEAGWINMAALISQHVMIQRLANQKAQGVEEEWCQDVLKRFDEGGGFPIFFAFVEGDVIDIRKVIHDFNHDNIKALVEDGWRLLRKHRDLVWRVEVMGMHPAYFPKLPKLVQEAA